jgi:hypothetical protein
MQPNRLRAHWDGPDKYLVQIISQEALRQGNKIMEPSVYMYSNSSNYVPSLMTYVCGRPQARAQAAAGRDDESDLGSAAQAAVGSDDESDLVHNRRQRGRQPPGATTSSILFMRRDRPAGSRRARDDDSDRSCSKEEVQAAKPHLAAG